MARRRLYRSLSINQTDRYENVGTDVIDAFVVVMRQCYSRRAVS